MRQKNKGRKIYKTKEKNYYGKTPMGKFFSRLLTVLLIGGIGFVGYSVAEPIMKYTKQKGDKVDINLPEETTAAEETSVSETSSESGEEIPTENSLENYSAAVLSVNDMISLDILGTALKSVPKDSGIQYIEVPLKAKGGNIYYASGIYEAKAADAVRSDIKAADIADTIRAAGFKPVALINTFSDNILPVTYAGTGYTITDDSSQWLDESFENGGKPWLSPLSAAALDYISNIVDEVSAAGFEYVVCSDIVYPDFRESDLKILDEKLSSQDNFMALTSAANLFYDKALKNGAAMAVEVSAADILRGKSSVLQPMLLSAGTVIVNIDIDEISGGVTDGWTVYEFSGTAAEKTKKMLGFINEKLKGFNVAVRISGTTVSTEEKLKAKEESAAFGYHSFVIG